MYRDLAEEWSNEKAKNFAYWESKIQLIGSQEAIEAIKTLKESEPGTEKRNTAHKCLMDAMRQDLSL